MSTGLAVGIGLGWLALWLASGVLAAAIAAGKGRSPVGFGMLGLMLGLLGVAIALCVTDAPLEQE